MGISVKMLSPFVSEKRPLRIIALDAPPAPRTGTHSSAAQYSTKKSPELCAAFLMWLAKGYVPLVAAQNVGIARSTAFTWKREDPDFAAAWAEAVEAGVDLLEQEALRRARDGVDRPVPIWPRSPATPGAPGAPAGPESPFGPAGPGAVGSARSPQCEALRAVQARHARA
jgi:hypothetical protein